MSGVTQIGKCIGCDAGPRKLDGDVCERCLSDPKRGRKWAEMAHQIRTDSNFALGAYNQIGKKNPKREIVGKMLFIRMFGLPEGATAPSKLKVVEEPSEDEVPRRILRLVR